MSNNVLGPKDTMMKKKLLWFLPREFLTNILCLLVLLVPDSVSSLTRLTLGHDFC